MVLLAVFLEDILGLVFRVLGGVGELEQVLSQVVAQGELLQHGTAWDQQSQGVGRRTRRLDELQA